MKTRVWLCALVLVLAVPLSAARRRSVTPGDPDHCVGATLSQAFLGAQLMAVDEQHVYVVDSFGGIARVPKLGGEIEMLVFSIGDWIPLSMTVDATHIYIGAQPSDSIFTKEPHAILRMAKSGGVPSVFVENVKTPFSMASDATHVYWAAAGTIDFFGGNIESDGKIERVQKDGSNRQTIADDLSAPLAMTIDANNVYYSETGVAEDDPTMGVFRIAKSGGTPAEIGSGIGAILMTNDGNTLVLFGGTQTEGGIVALEKNGSGGMRVLYAGEPDVDEEAGNSIRIADRRAYFIRYKEGSPTGSDLVWASIDAPTGGVTIVRSELFIEDDFVLDGCAAIVSTQNGELVRVKR